jgi:hypothetical protein
MQVAGRKHNSDDLIATALAVEPMKVVYRARIVIFSIRVLRDERIIIVAEQRPDIGEDECFQWMSRVLQAIDSIHQVGVYCLALCPANTLPKVIQIIFYGISVNSFFFVIEPFRNDSCSRNTSTFTGRKSSSMLVRKRKKLLYIE